MKNTALKVPGIASQIHFIRGEQVILDFNLALLYGVETRILKQAVKRNSDRFPKDFMFELTKAEISGLVSQNVIPSKSYAGGARPMAFTEQGVAMISGLLRSERAVAVNIAIMRTFVQLRKLMDTSKALSKKIENLEKKYDAKFHLVFEAIKELIREENKPRKRIGFRGDD